MTLMRICDNLALYARRCRVAEIFDDPGCARLFAEYEKECANPVLGSTAPIRGLYEALELHEAFGQCFAAYYGGELVGFAFLLAARVPHYGRHFATVESLFVSKSARYTGIGLDLIEAVESHAKECGCTAILYTAPVESQLAKLLHAMPGYVHTNLLFTRCLA